MKFLLVLLFIPFLFGIEKLIRFFSAGGTLTQPARNATFLYLQTKIVYHKMPDAQARFMALWINSFSARNEMPESFLREMLEEYANSPWEDLCVTYAWAYAAHVGHVDITRLSEKLIESRSEKIREQIKFAEFSVARGDRRYESMLRSMSQDEVLLIIAKSKGIL